MKKLEFFHNLKKLNPSEGFDFYYSFGSDEYTHTGWQRRTSEYTFSIVNKNGSFIIEQKRTGKCVHQLKLDLIDKYTKWTNNFIKTLNNHD